METKRPRQALAENENREFSSKGKTDKTGAKAESRSNDPTPYNKQIGTNYIRWKLSLEHDFNRTMRIPLHFARIQ